MAQKKERKPRPIPEFKIREEELNLGIHDDTTDFEDEFKPVELHFADHFTHRTIVDLDPEGFNKLSQCAHQKGTGVNYFA